jgi:hypothetical protein
MNELFYSFFVKIRAIRGCLVFSIRGCVICLLLTPALQLKASEEPSYKGLMRIPIDLMTPDGVRLEKGQYELEVKPEASGHVLSFSSGGQVKAVVKPVADSDLITSSSASIPVVGTHYLRPSTEPLLTGEERRFSKTGRAQYEEETRQWKATLRVYKSPDNTVFFVFRSRGPRWQWNHFSFKLSQSK